MKLSIVIPVFNEEKTIEEILKRLVSVQLSPFEKELIVINDGSTDKSGEKIRKFMKKNKSIKYIEKANGGKGTAVRKGIEEATGQYILIQDADLEYSPKDIPLLLNIVKNKSQQVAYGTRLKRFPNFRRDERTPAFLSHYIGNKFLSLVTSVLYGQWITDMETCYKLFPKSAVEKMKLVSRGFDFEPEITAKLLKKGYKITEVPITTNPRNYQEGKKLNSFRDGPIALWALLKYRILE